MHTTRKSQSVSMPGRPNGGVRASAPPLCRAARALAAPLCRAARALAPLALLAAAGIHGAQAAHHLTDGTFHARLHASFFVVAAVLQIAGAVAATAGRHVSAVVVGNLFLTALWTLDVTVGLPTWVAPGSPGPVTVAGVTATVLQILAASALMVARHPRDEGRTTPRWADVRLSAPLAGAGVALVAVGFVLPVPAHSHHHASGEHHSHHHTAGDRHSRGAAHADSAAHAETPIHVDGVHLHALGGDPFDAGPDPIRQARDPLAGTRLPVGTHPSAITVDATKVWVAEREAGLVHRLDARTGASLGAPTPVGVHPAGIAVGEESVWVTNAGDNTVSRLDPVTGQSLGAIPVGKVPVGVTVGAGSVWVANSAEGTVSRVDPATGAVSTTGRIGYGPTAITVVAGKPWVVTSLDRAVVSLDPDTGAVLTETSVGAGPTSIVVGHGSVWVASSSAGTVTRIDPLTGNLVGEPIVVDRNAQPGQGPSALAVTDRVWVLNNHDKTVVAIDPSTHAISTAQFIDRRVGDHIAPASLASDAHGALWATEHDSGAVVHLGQGKELQ